MKQNPGGAAHRHPGVVENTNGCAKNRERERYSISPDPIEYAQQRASAFHRNVIGGGLFCVKGRIPEKQKSILHSENGGLWTEIGVIPSVSVLLCPLWTPDGRISGSFPGVFGSDQSAHNAAG